MKKPKVKKKVVNEFICPECGGKLKEMMDYSDRTRTFLKCECGYMY